MARVSVPAPYGGVNVLAGVGTIQPPDAVRLVNFVPRIGGCEMRAGTRYRYSTSGNAIQTIAPYSGLTDTSVTLGGTVVLGYGGILDAVATGTWTQIAATASITAVNIWQWTQFGDRLILVNGNTTPRSWDGAAFASLTITGTGLTSSTLIWALTFKGRVYYGQVGKRSFWYCAAAAFQGAVTEFQLNQFTHKDGVLLFMCPLTIDGGSGPDDLAAFVFSNGEVLLYQGDDPASPSAWQQIGRFQIAQPRGHQAWTIIGATTIVDTVSGPVDLQRALQTGPVDLTATFGQKVSGTVQVDPATATRFTLLQAQNERLLIRTHYDASTLAVETLAMDMDSRAWTLLRGWEDDATAMGISGGALLIGDSSGFLCEYGGVAGDQVGQGSATFVSVFYEGLTAYTDLGAAGQRIQVTAIYPVIVNSGTTSLSGNQSVGISTDYQDQDRTGFTNPTVFRSVDAATIGGVEKWLSIGANGFVIAVFLRFTGPSSGISPLNLFWYRTDLLVRVGGPL